MRIMRVKLMKQVAALPLGYFLDRAGPRTACIFGGLVFGAGCITFSLGIVRTCAYLLSSVPMWRADEKMWTRT